MLHMGSITSRSRIEFERLPPEASQYREVAPVQRHDGCRAYALGQHDHGCIGCAQRQIAIAAHKFADSDPVLRLRRHHLETRKARDETGFNLRPVPLSEKVAHLCDAERRNYRCDLPSRERLDASSMVWVGRICGCQQRATVNDREQWRPPSYRLGRHQGCSLCSLDHRRCPAMEVSWPAFCQSAVPRIPGPPQTG